MPANAKPEQQRLDEANARQQAWRNWGPYVSERQWGTVREDYSADGDAWNYFPHEHARSRAYRWGEDGIGGFCDAKQTLCMAVALWNGKDPILKERMFGLSNRQGNHGEDVKELYYYLDAAPTYSYARMLYKYPQAEFPYDLLVQENARRSRQEPEYEILDTGVFDANRYFDVDIEYAKAGAADIFLRLTITNRGPEEATIHVLPQVWFRNTWSWFADHPKPSLARAGDDVVVNHEKIGIHAVQFDRPDEIKFCENETNVAKLYGRQETGYRYKDGLHDYVVRGRETAVDSSRGTKAAGIYRRTIAAPSPLSAYGRTKLHGEGAAGERAWIVRTSGLFSENGTNFVTTMLRLGRARGEVAVVDDQRSAPTYARHLAAATKDLLGRPQGVWHVAADGDCTWAEFAEAIFEDAGLDVRVRRISSEELGRPAPRPAYSVLRSEKDAPRLPHWRDGLRACLERLA